MWQWAACGVSAVQRCFLGTSSFWSCLTLPGTVWTKTLVSDSQARSHLPYGGLSLVVLGSPGRDQGFAEQRRRCVWKSQSTGTVVPQNWLHFLVKVSLFLETGIWKHQASRSKSRDADTEYCILCQLLKQHCCLFCLFIFSWKTSILFRKKVTDHQILWVEEVWFVIIKCYSF